MLRWLSILVVALALVAAGCGGSDDESAASTETTIEETTTTDETTTADETTTEESTDTSGIDTGAFNFASEDCQSLVKAYVGLSAAIAAASSGQDVTADIEKFSKLRRRGARGDSGRRPDDRSGATARSSPSSRTSGTARRDPDGGADPAASGSLGVV